VSQADCDKLQYYSRRVKFFEFICEDSPRIHPSTYFRIGQLWSTALFPSLRRLHYYLDEDFISHIFLHLSPLLHSLELFNIRGFENTIVQPFLATLSSPMIRHIVLRNGELSVDTFKKSFVHFKLLQSLELFNAVSISDFGLWEVLGRLPSLENLTLVVNDPATHPTHAPENSNSQSRGPRYFEVLESLCVTGSFFLIQHLLGFINSPYLKSIELYPVINREPEPEDLFTPSIIMTIVSSKWSQSLKNLVFYSSSIDTERYPFLEYFMLLMDLEKMQTFRLDWMMRILDDDVFRLVAVVSRWRKLRTLNLNHTVVSLSTLGIIAKERPELRHLHIRLDTSTLPPFPSKNLCHKLEVLTVGRAHPRPPSKTMLERQIQVTRYLDLIFPYLKSIEVQPKDVFWSGIRDLVQFCQDRDASLSRRVE
jgi:hypothetical protein